MRPTARSKAPEGCPSSRTHVWERWHRWSQYAFYVMLALATALAFFFGEPTAWELRAKALAAVAILAAWHWCFQLRSPGWYYSNIGIRLAYISGLSLLFIALVQTYPDYWLFAFMVFWQIWIIGSVAWSGAASVALTVILLGMEGVPFTGTEGALNLGAVAVASTVSILLGLFISSLINQSEERHRLIEELEETREELAKEERRAGILEERGRLAREIHDTLAQGFISIVTHLEAAEVDGVSGDARRHLDQARQTARENLVEARRLVAALRPEILESSSLPTALERLAERWSESSGVGAEVNVAGDELRLSQDLQITLLRAAQEALSNVGRHAGAKSVSITLSYTGELVILDVHDDGRGFDPDSPQSKPNGDGGFGLRAMRERVESLGGRLLVESDRGEGTTLAAQIPVGSERSAERSVEAR